MYQPNQFQVDLFEEIFKSTSGKTRIVQELMEVLGCSRASLYRKRTGSTPLTADELVKLANHFSLSLDALRKEPEENSEVVVCTTLPPINQYSDIDFYLENTKQNMELAVSQPTAQLYFAAKELPLHRYLYYPTLSAFRYYLWVSENMRQHEPFDPLAIPSDLISKGRALAELSHNIKTTEYWLPSAFDNIIGQITYIKKSSRISSRLLQRIKEELHLVVNDLVESAKTERTKGGMPYQMILCHYLTLSDGALVEITPTTAQVLFSYSSINYMKSSNPKVIQAYKRGLRYHRMEGEALTALESDRIDELATTIRAKIDTL